MLREYVATFKDPQAYAISHIGWGLQPRASWTTLGLYDREATIGMDARAYEGNFLFSLGPNNEAGQPHDGLPYRHSAAPLHGAPGRARSGARGQGTD